MFLLYNRYLKCSKPFLFASLITFYLDMRHLLTELTHKRVHLNMFEAGICQIFVQLLYLIQRTTPYHTGSQISLNFRHIPTTQSQPDAFQPSLILLRRLWSRHKPSYHTEQTLNVVHKAIVPVCDVLVLRNSDHITFVCS